MEPAGIIAIIATTAGFILAGGGFVGAFFISARMARKKRLAMFPQHITGWESRMASSPFAADLVGMALEALVDAWEDHLKTPEEDIRKAVNRLNISWVPGTTSGAVQKRFFTDRFGRKIAGDYEPRTGLVRVCFIPSDKIGSTAFFHECGHGLLHFLEGDPDSDHADGILGGKTWTAEVDMVVSELKARFRD